MLKDFLDRHAVPEWRQAHRLWSVQAPLFWAAVSGLYMAIPAFQGTLTPMQYAGLCIGVQLICVIGRLTDQPGVPNT